jgi:hypothetical protein
VPLLGADETAAAMWARHVEAAGMKDSTAAWKLTAVSSYTALIRWAGLVAGWSMRGPEHGAAAG